MGTPRVGITLRDMMFAVMIFALIMAIVVDRLPTPHLSLTINVFNQTTTPLDHLGYDLLSDDPESEPFRLRTVVAGAGSMPGALAPGSMDSCVMNMSGQATYTLAFSCTMPDGTLRTGRVTISVNGGHPISLNFYVQPSGVKAAIDNSDLPP